MSGKLHPCYSRRRGWEHRPPMIALPDTPEGKAEAKRQFKADWGARYAGIYIGGHIRDDLVLYAVRLRAANAV